MTIYQVVIDPYDEARGYGIHVFPAQFDSAAPVLYALDDAELTNALSKLNIVNNGILTDLNASLKAGKGYDLPVAIQLSDEVAAEFGWKLR